MSEQTGMGSEGRIDAALAAALAVVDTLTWADYANVVLFSTNAVAYSASGLKQTRRFTNRRTCAHKIVLLKMKRSNNVEISY